jgi:putative restriction endonuclease
MDHDTAVRIAVFKYLDQLRLQYGQILPWRNLQKGFVFDGNVVPLIGATGIWKPKILDLPISIATSPSKPYNDTFADDGYLDYKYRQDKAGKSDNDRLRSLMLKGKPLVYFHAMSKGKYDASWPVFIVGDNPGVSTFKVAVEDRSEINKDHSVESAAESAVIRRKYLTRLTRVRLHQSAFRVQVLEAYREQCTICSLKHVSLLEAAHIIPDSHEDGVSTVTNGLSLCKIHHAAYDQNILGITPDYKAEIRMDILDEIDGPMLKHGIQEMHGKSIILPRSVNKQPDKELISRRYEEFKSA